jgi:hypothetical protein
MPGDVRGLPVPFEHFVDRAATEFLRVLPRCRIRVQVSTTSRVREGGRLVNLCGAIQGRRLLSFTYEGHQRVVIPAAHGTLKTTGNAVVRGYQIRGTSSSGSEPQWRLFLVDEMIGLQVLQETFGANPPQYSRGDKHINVHCEL